MSLRSTSQRGAQEHVRRAPIERAVARAQAGGRRLVGTAAVRRGPARPASPGRRPDRDRASPARRWRRRRRARAAARATTPTARSSRPVNGSSNSTSRGPCSSARSSAEPLPHAAREPDDRFVRAVGKPGALERRVDAARPRIEAVQLARRTPGSAARDSSGYRCSSCASRPMRRRSAGPSAARRALAVADLARGRRRRASRACR